MEDRARLERLSVSRLVDVVKNYRQYGYDENTRTVALEILNGRGVSVEQLELTGNMENRTYGEAERVRRSYVRNSRTALVLYCISFIAGVYLPDIFGVLAGVGIFAVFAIYFVRSLIDYNNFCKLVGRTVQPLGILAFLVGGLVGYVLFFFVYDRSMKKAMAAIC